MLLCISIRPRLALLCGLTVGLPAAARAQVVEPLPHRQDATTSFGLPFKLVGGLIVLQQLTLNGQRGDFILDTGNTSALLVERTAFAGQLWASDRHPTGHGATGTVALQELPVISFRLGAARYTGFAAHALALAAVRADVGGHLLSVISYELLRGYEVVIPHRRVSFYSLRAGTPPAVRAAGLAGLCPGAGPAHRHRTRHRCRLIINHAATGACRAEPAQPSLVGSGSA